MMKYYLATVPLGTGDWSLREPARFDMEFESALGAPGAWAPVPGVPGAEGAGGGPGKFFR